MIRWRRTLAALVIALIGVLGAIALESDGSTVFTLVVLIVLTAIAVMVFGVFWRRERRIPLLCDPLFLAFAFLSQFYVVGALAIEIFGQEEFPYMRPFEPFRRVDASLGFLLLVVAIVIGYQSPVGRLIARVLPDFSGGTKKFPGRWAVAILIGGSIGGCLSWLEYQGGLQTKISQGYSAGKAGSAMFMIAHVALVVGTLLAGWRLIASESRRASAWWAFAGLLVFDGAFFGLIYGVRKYLFFIYFGLLAIWLLRRGFRALPKVRVAVVLVGLLIFFAIWGTVRSRSLTDMARGDVDPRAAGQPPTIVSYFSGVSEPYFMACLVWDLFPDVEPYRHGETLLVTVLGFIPRAVWPDKPVGIGKDLTRYVVGPFYEPVYGYSIAITYPGDLYANFGWLGVALGGIVLGIGCRAMTEYAADGLVEGLQTNAARVLIPALFVVGLGEVRSDVATLLATDILAFVPLIATLMFFNLDVSPARSKASARLVGSREPA